jgi:two-component system sensor histidine kinase ChiS
MLVCTVVAMLLTSRVARAADDFDAAVPVYDFTEVGDVRQFPMKRPWAVYRDALVEDDARTPDGRLLSEVHWGKYPFEPGTTLAAYGCHTYHVRVRLPPAWRDGRTPLALSFPYEFHATRVVVRSRGPSGGRWEALSGVPGCTKDDEVPLHRRVRLLFAPDGDLDVFMQLSNFHAMRGGLVRSPTLGTANAVLRRRDLESQADFFMIGVLGVAAVYHAAQWLLHRSQLQTLYFALMCAVMAVRAAVFGNYFEAFEPSLISFATSQRLVYLTIDGAMYFTIAFLDASLPNTLPRWMLRAFGVLCGGVSLFVLLLEVPTFGPLIFISEALVAIGSVIVIASCLRAVVRDRSVHAQLTLMSFLVLASTAVWDLVIDHMRSGQVFVAPYGTLGFVLIQAFAIALQNARAREAASSLSAELASRGDRLLQLDALKNEFLATTSHELRTPLNGIIGLSETLLQRTSVRTDREATNHLLAIADSGRRLTTLIDDILDYSKLRTRKLALDRKPVSVRRIVDQVLLLSRSLPGAKPVDLREVVPHDLPPVYADENRLRQVLQNLVGNAIKFTERGFVEVTACVAGDWVEVRVRDSGIGIPEEKFDAIFETFEQLDSGPTRGASGTGLGLAITRQLVELHGGSIDVHSALGLGSTFVFTIPIAKGAPLPLPMADASRDPRAPEASPLDVDALNAAPIPSGRPRWNILAVDDDAANLLVLRAQLDPKEFGVTPVRDPRDAVRVFREEGPFDAVLLDVMMPKVSGLEVARELRRLVPAARCPIIFLSARTALDDFAASFGAGGSDFLSKPVVRVELLARLRHHLHVAAAYRELERPLEAELAALLKASSGSVLVVGARLVSAEASATHLSAIVDAIRDANAAPFFLSASFVLAVLPGARAADADSVHEALAGVVGASCPIARTVGHLFMVAPDDDRDAGPVLAGSAVDDLLRALYTDN